MYQPKVLGPVAAVGATMATLPVTGQSVVGIALVGVGLLVAGALLIRASRSQRGSV